MSRIVERQQPRKKIRDRAAVKAYMDAHQVCEVCGGKDCHNWQMGPHHLLGGPARSDEPCNLLACGWCPCHLRMETTGILWVMGKRFEPIRHAEQLRIKEATGYWDPVRLKELYGRELPT